MQPIQMNTGNFSYAGAPAGTAVPSPIPFRTLDDLRVVHDNYDTAPGKSGKPMGAVIAAIVVLGAAAFIAYGYYNEDASNKAVATAPAVDPSVPATSAALPIKPAPASSTATTATDTPASGPAGPMTKREEANAMPLAGQGNSHSSDSLNPAKAPAAKAAPSVQARTPKAPAARSIAPANSPAFEPLPTVEPAAKVVTPPLTQPEPVTPPAEVPPPKPDAQ